MDDRSPQICYSSAGALTRMIQDQLPVGSAQSYAAMLILNQLYSYSDKYGLQMGMDERVVIASHSLEFLYLAWSHDVGVELSQGQVEKWPSHVWRDSISLGIDLASLIKDRHDAKAFNHEKFRDVRTLLSFGAVVNHYYENIRRLHGGMEHFKWSYHPTGFSVEGFQLDPLLSAKGPPGTDPRVGDKSGEDTGDDGWSWPFNWGQSSHRGNRETSTLPGSSSLPAVDTAPKVPPGSDAAELPSVSASTLLDSVSMSGSGTVSTSGSTTLPSSATDSSIWSSRAHVSAMERLEAYLSVLGTPQCEQVKPFPVQKSRLVLLEAIEAPVRVRPRGLIRPDGQGPIAALTNCIQRPHPQATGSPRRLDWVTGRELRMQKILAVTKGGSMLIKGERARKRQLRALNFASTLKSGRQSSQVASQGAGERQIIDID